MQIRCNNCHKPFALGKEAIHEALDLIAEEDLNHFNVSCPHCRKNYKASREELVRAAPGWTQSETKNQQEPEA